MAKEEEQPAVDQSNKEGIKRAMDMARNNSRRKKVKARRKPKIEDKYTLSECVVGRGTFGTVYQGTCKASNRRVAVKKVKIDLRYRNRELQMIAMVKHPNVVRLLETFSRYDDLGNYWIHIVMEYMNRNMYESIRAYRRQRRHIPLKTAKMWAYQICRGVAYIHRLGIVHRDMKPQNILVNTHTGEVKLCDFGSAKIPAEGEQSVAYIGSRYYRAPELIFEATAYRHGIDVWATGCVIAEMMLGEPLFVGNNNDELLENITDVLGRPTRDQVFHMNPVWRAQGKWKNYKLSEEKVQTDFLRQQYGTERYDEDCTVPAEFIQLLREFFVYVPAERCTAADVMAHTWFDELREPGFAIPGLDKLPALFDWSDEEIAEAKELGIWAELQQRTAEPQPEEAPAAESSGPVVDGDTEQKDNDA